MLGSNDSLRGRPCPVAGRSLRPMLVGASDVRCLAQTTRFGVARAPSPDAHFGHRGLRSLGACFASPSMAALASYAGSRSTGDPSLSAPGGVHHGVAVSLCRCVPRHRPAARMAAPTPAGGARPSENGQDDWSGARSAPDWPPPWIAGGARPSENGQDASSGARIAPDWPPGWRPPWIAGGARPSENGQDARVSREFNQASPLPRSAPACRSR